MQLPAYVHSIREELYIIRVLRAILQHWMRELLNAAVLLVLLRRVIRGLSGRGLAVAG